jgi:hypothetical protein
LPVTNDAFQKTINLRYVADTKPDIFISRFDTDGNLRYGTYYGGKGEDVSYAIAVDKDDNYAVTGYIKFSKEFPVSDNAFQKDTAGLEDCFVIKFNNNNERQWATLIGGNRLDIYYCLIFSNNQIIACGTTFSTNFPGANDSINKVTTLLQDIIITSFGENDELIWSKYFGGVGGEDAQGISINGNYIWITGYTQSPDLPASKTALPNFYPNAQAANIYLLQMDLNGFPVWCSYYSGGQIDFGYNISFYKNKIVFTGETESVTFPVTNNAYQKIIGTGQYSGYLVYVNVEATPVDEINVYNKFKIYPNPINDYLYIDNNNLMRYEYRISNILGQTLLTGFIKNNEYSTKIDLSTLSSGYYFLTIENYSNIYTIPLLKY